ncbi:hypothetical protein Scep_025277 [Stephania cephalantha]|uniref:FAE domain-containing protein n=1 Tax=Stephania cephalantha TaxID=152367 RepID=A0AAP0HM68_9MAGN
MASSSSSSSIEMEKERLTAEVAFKDSSSVVIRIKRSLPDFLQSVKLKYVKLAIISLFSLLYWLNKRHNKPVYLVDFACYKPLDEQKISVEGFVDMTKNNGAFLDDTIEFQKRISTRSGLGDETYLPSGITAKPPKLSMKEARAEAEAVMFGALDSLFEKTGLNPKDIKILIVNCSLFNPTPSLSSMIVNHYKMREDIKSFNLGGMGCSAGLISIDLAKDLLKSSGENAHAIVVSMENITLNWYFGNDRSMLLCNCIFRMGGAAVLLSNKAGDRARSKYQLIHTVRTHKGSDDNSYNCVYQREDNIGTIGVSLARELMAVAGDALKTNITTLGPLVLPFTEQLMFFVTLVRKKMFKQSKVKPYIPDFKTAFEHFCIHAGGRAVLDEVQKNLGLSEWHMEPSLPQPRRRYRCADGFDAIRPLLPLLPVIRSLPRRALRSRLAIVPTAPGAALAPTAPFRSVGAARRSRSRWARQPPLRSLAAARQNRVSAGLVIASMSRFAAAGGAGAASYAGGRCKWPQHGVKRITAAAKRQAAAATRARMAGY